jgi:SAM-dependent methyltransferase
MPIHPISEHNSFYLAEDKRQQPKEYFKFLVLQAGSLLASASVRVVDIGCATGDFLYYLRSLHREASLTGTDVSPEFIAKAKENVPDACFFIADIYSGAHLPATRFDVVFMSGINYLYADFEPWLRNVILLTAGTAYIFGVFNPEDLDVRATVQRSGDKNSATPWNLISRKTISVFLDSLGMRYRFTDWELPIPTPRSQEDPLRSWTIPTADGHLLVVNGMQIVHRFAVLQIDVAA